MNSRTQKESELKTLLIGKTISDAFYYCMNRPSYLFPDAPEQLIDAGVSIKIGENDFFSLGMNFNFVAIDTFVIKYDEIIKEFSDELPFVEVLATEDSFWKNCIGEKIEQIYIVWNWFEDVEEQIYYIPQDIEFELSNGKYLAFCTTSYNIDDEGLNILEPDSEGEILVLFSPEDTKFFKRGRYYEGNNNLPVEP